jgi:TM2 domain-containing membrane protein YozV
MTQGPDDNENTAPLPPDGWQQPPAGGWQQQPPQQGPPPEWQQGPPQGPPQGQQGPPQGPPQGWQPPPPGWQPPPGPYGYGYPPNPAAPYGIHPITGIPYSDKSKVVAGVLQLVVPLGIGRFYMGDTNIGIAQLLVTLVTCGVGALWPFIDGILILVNDTATDAQGRPLRPS